MLKRIISYAFVICSAMLGSLSAMASEPVEMVAYSAALDAGSYGAQSARHRAVVTDWALSGGEHCTNSQSNLTRIGNHFVMQTAKPVAESEPMLA